MVFERHDVTLSVASWNVMNSFTHRCRACEVLVPNGRECSCGWRFRRILEVVKLLMDTEVEVIFLQEVGRKLLGELQRCCATQEYAVISNIYHEEQMGVAVLLARRFRILAVQQFHVASSVRAVENHKKL
eukprot:TRINITY_DN90587_c0_g1_i1.p1 TRINITY_DN90587_c0_g1~~TRINITY_DN90587_c0_g1_i1.p1  ORF type:complete len:130 (+),score=13.97 TRINITY_DN90587_c0_g1_i1:71-460(+)